MDIKSKIFKRKTGKSKGKWVIRINYYDEINGKQKVMERHAEKRSDAVDRCESLINNIKKSFGQIQTGDKMTFEALADYCETHFYQDAEIVEGRKIAGVRSKATAIAQLSILKQFFGDRLLREITTENLNAYKLWRIKTKSDRTGANIKISTANRELSAMRKMMRFAFGKGWVMKDIFFNAKVIDVSAEIERKRLLSSDEETRLLASCQGEREITYKRKIKGIEKEVTATISVDNPHLKAMIILALDSGMRRGEIFKLRWQDINFDTGIIQIVGTHTKTERERIAPLSQRAKDELEKLKPFTKGENPFPFTDIKRSFATAKRLAKIDDLHFHDLRRTAITRWLQNGTPLAFAGKFAGHSQLQTTMKHYTSTDAGMIQELNEKMNNYNSQTKEINQIESKMLN